MPATRKPRCAKCQRVFFTVTTRADGTLALSVPDYGLPMALVDAQKLLYLLTCTKCGNRELHHVPLAPPLQSPTIPSGQANVITGGISTTGLPDAIAGTEPPPEDAPDETAESPAPQGATGDPAAPDTASA
jgi:hypothetical protein